MDGTLLDSGKHFLPDSKAAVAEAAEAGKIVCIATGRCMAEMEFLMEELPEVRYVIGASGAFIYDRTVRNYIYRNEIPAEKALELLRRTEDLDTQLVLMSDESYSQRDKVFRMADYHMAQYQYGYEKYFVLPEDIIAFYRAAPFPVFKMNYYCLTSDDRTLVASRLSDLGMALVFAEGTSLEVTLKEATKGSGFRKLCELLGIDRSRTVAVGDADNDLPVLAEAGLAVAMGNSNEHVLNAADVVVADNDSGGCAEAIRSYLLP